MLTQWGVDVSEQLQVPLYLEATDRSASVYRRLGFQLLDKTVRIKAEVMGTDRDADAPLMARMPSSAGELTFEDWAKEGRPALGIP
jgi:hypothetical protein